MACHLRLKGPAGYGGAKGRGSPDPARLRRPGPPWLVLETLTPPAGSSLSPEMEGGSCHLPRPSPRHLLVSSFLFPGLPYPQGAVAERAFTILPQANILAVLV